MVEEYFLTLLESANLFWLFVGAFGAGAITSLAPCSLVTVPLLVGGAIGMSSHLEPKQRVRFSFIFASLFALGVIVSFSVLAFLVAKLGFLFAVAPFWAYLMASVLAILLGFYSFGILPQIDKQPIFAKLIKLRFVGIFLIGIIFGLVSTPCASAPLVAIISLASTLGGLEAYLLVLTFAFGHSLLLLVAGVSVGFTQKVVSSAHIGKLTGAITKFFALVLVVVGIYFAYMAAMVL